MIRRLFLLVLLSIVVIFASRTIPPADSTIQKSCSQGHQAWVTDILQRMETIKPGMTRAELLKVFTTEGGLSTGLQRTFMSRDYAHITHAHISRLTLSSKQSVDLTATQTDV